MFCGPEESSAFVELDVLFVQVSIEQVVQTSIAAGEGIELAFMLEYVDDLDEKLVREVKEGHRDTWLAEIRF
jgi:hypothetical protein